MKKISARLSRFPEYIFSRLAKKVKEVELKTGKKVLDLGAGSPDFPPSPLYVKKLQELFTNKKAHMYPGYGPLPEFTNSMVLWYKKRFGVTLEKNEIFSLCGGKDGLGHVALALFDDGDEVLMPNPGYPGFSGPTLLVGAEPVFYDLLPKNNFKPSLTNMQKKVTKKTVAMWLNFPGNPTGQVMTKKELIPFVKFAQKNNIWLLYDNAYSEITFDGFVAPSIFEIPGAKEIAVEFGTFSKMFSFAGYRIGWVAGNVEIINALAKVKSQIDSGLTRPFQLLASYALDNVDIHWQKEMITSYKNRRDEISKLLDHLGLTYNLSKGSLYIWAQIPHEAIDSESWSTELLEKKQILLTPGTAFGENGRRYVRASICTNIDEIKNYY